MRPNILKFFPALAVMAAVTPVLAFEEDVYGEAALPRFEAPETVPERDVVMPAYPADSDLSPLDASAGVGAFRVFIDPGSISLGADRIVRYTVVMRSAAGADNVLYEGLRCDTRQYRRYGYGSNGEMQPVARSEWKFVKKIARDAYRVKLLDDYFCPLPRGENPEKLRARFRKPD